MDARASPTITVTADEGAVGAPSPVATSKTVRFQCGLLRETETFSEDDLEDVSLDAILEYVVEMLNVKVRVSLHFTPRVHIPQEVIVLYGVRGRKLHIICYAFIYTILYACAHCGNHLQW